MNIKKALIPIALSTASTYSVGQSIYTKRESAHIQHVENIASIGSSEPKAASTLNNEADTLTFSALNKTKLQFFLDDTYLFGGLTISGIHYSDNFRQLEHRPGFILGIEQYFPLSGKLFFSTGINIAQRNFSFSNRVQDVHVSNLFIDLPVSTAFELPILRNLDFRLLLGANVGIRANSSISSSHSIREDYTSDLFVYDVSDFNRMDFGWTFGLSSEYRNIIFRFRSYAGLVKLDRKDQGMMSSFHFEIGYFLFRSLNNKQ